MMIAMLIILYRHWQLGFSFSTINQAANPFFRNHVNYSALLVLMIPVLVGLIGWYKHRSARIFLSALLILALLALFFYYARGAWVALLVGGVAWWLIKKRLLLASYVAALAIMIVLLFWVKANDRYLAYAPNYKTTIFHENFSEHLVSTYKLKDLSSAERYYRWIAGIRMIKDHPVTGVGPNTFYDNYKPYTIPAYKTYVSDNPEHSTVHNYFLLTVVEQGIPGLILWVLLIGTMLWYAQRLYHRSADRFYKGVAMVVGVISCMMVSLNMLSDLIETDKLGSLFFMCIGMLVVKPSLSHSTHLSIHSPPY
jgi:O-antigen ligase